MNFIRHACASKPYWIVCLLGAVVSAFCKRSQLWLQVEPFEPWSLRAHVAPFRYFLLVVKKHSLAETHSDLASQADCWDPKILNAGRNN